MKATVSWHGRMSFTGTADTNFIVPLGSAPEVGGDNDGFRPMELILTGLAGCTAMDVISILQKKRQAVTGFRVEADATQPNEHPHVFTSAVVHYFVTGHQVDEAAVVRAIELSAVRYCPAQAMFANVFPIELKYSIFEDNGSDQHTLVKSGAYVPVAKAES